MIEFALIAFKEFKNLNGARTKTRSKAIIHHTSLVTPQRQRSSTGLFTVIRHSVLLLKKVKKEREQCFKITRKMIYLYDGEKIIHQSVSNSECTIKQGAPKQTVLSWLMCVHIINIKL